MALYYDTETEDFDISPDNCQDCGDPLYDTGCDAPGCQGRSCVSCGTGCDIEVAPETGRCASALAEEPEDDRQVRFDKERAAFGLPPLRP